MLKCFMKILYMPGLASIVDKQFDLSKSCKLVHLMELAVCTVFDYKQFHPSSIIQYVSNFDLLFGSSFGGFFAFYLALATGKPSISVNPSLFLDERIDTLIKEYPRELSFVNKSHLKAIKSEPKSKPAENISIIMNLDDEVIDAYKVVDKAEKYGCRTYTFEKGGHQSSNFQGDMLPTIKMILNGLES